MSRIKGTDAINKCITHMSFFVDLNTANEANAELSNIVDELLSLQRQRDAYLKDKYSLIKSLGRSRRKINSIEAERDAYKAALESPCLWHQDNEIYNTWVTSCGDTHMFIADGPIENGYKHCPYCGHKIIIRSALEKAGGEK